MIPFPDKKYSVIYADPPWSYSGGGAKRNVTRHYHTMKAKDIYDLPVQDIAADDCLLFMWATSRTWKSPWKRSGAGDSSIRPPPSSG